MKIHERIQEMYDEGLIGIDSNISSWGDKKGGQHCGTPIRGTRIWYPKDAEIKDIDITIMTERSQHKNREIAIQLFELAMGL